VVVLFYLFIGRGLEPKQLAFSTALCIALGIFPICGMYVFCSVDKLDEILEAI